MADFPGNVDFPCPPAMKAWLDQLHDACVATQPLAGTGTTTSDSETGTAINASST